MVAERPGRFAGRVIHGVIALCVSGAVLGLPASAAVAIAATLLVAVIQAIAGLWLGRALAPGHG